MFQDNASQKMQQFCAIEKKKAEKGQTKQSVTKTDLTNIFMMEPCKQGLTDMESPRKINLNYLKVFFIVFFVYNVKD